MREALGLVIVVLCVCTSQIPLASAQPPHLDYLQHCAGCHKEDGSGSLSNEIPDMRGLIGHFARDSDGRAFLVQVAGVSQAPLPSRSLAALLNWTLYQFSPEELPDNFLPYTAFEVENLRKNRPANLPAARRKIAENLAKLGFSIENYPTGKQIDGNY